METAPNYLNSVTALFLSNDSILSSKSLTLSTWLTESAFPLWWNEGADHLNGGFFETIALNGHIFRGNRRFRVQPRQVYSYNISEQLEWNGPAAVAQQHGMRYLLTHYRCADGSFGALANDTGELIDSTFDLYNQAFALLAFACRARSAPDEREAMATEAARLRELLQGLRHGEMGFNENHDHKLPLCSNPHMHIFEACLAWEEVEVADAPVWRALADEIATLALTRFIDARSGGLREFFDADWRPMPGIAGRIMEPGHQFEWAWLLASWGRRRGRPDAIVAARRLFDIGMQHGICPRRQVARMQLLDDFSVHDDVARLWPQAEWIKAAVLLAVLSEGEERARYLRDTEAGVDALNRFLNEVPVAGLWRDKMRADGSWVEEAAPASSFYHIVCAIVELSDRLAELKG
ncbi:MAG TPA: AGE family epimerase/isomerase [Devosiaceae bacterium]